MKLWLVGAGTMAAEYAKVLKSLGQEFEVVGRGEETASRFEAATGARVLRGGVDAALRRTAPQAAIVAVGVAELASTAQALIKGGVKRLLIEKPAGLSLAELRRLRGRSVFVAYNRRFYSSALKARELIEADGGVLSFQFEFTEWSWQIADLPHPAKVKERWILANSSHVLDLAFHLGGEPAVLTGYRRGKLPWHPSGSVFAGAGRARSGALFSYQANWEAPGRWGVEVLTRRRRFVLRPLERLFVQEKGSLELKEEPLQDRLDRDFKPGLYLQTKGFLEGSSRLLSVADHVKRLVQWRKIGVEI